MCAVEYETLSNFLVFINHALSMCQVYCSCLHFTSSKVEMAKEKLTEIFTFAIQVEYF